MSRRSSRKSARSRDEAKRRTGKKRHDHGGSTMADQLKAKDPEKLDRLAKIAADAKEEPDFEIERRSLGKSRKVPKKATPRQMNKAPVRQSISRNKWSGKAKKEQRVPGAQPRIEDVSYKGEAKKNVPVVRRQPAKEKKKSSFKPSKPKQTVPDPVSEVEKSLLGLERPSFTDIPDQPIPPTVSNKLDKWLKAAPSAFEPSKPSKSPYAVIGFDLGSSSTKIVVQLPNVRSGLAEAMPVPGYFRADKHPHLWITAIWLCPTTGEFSIHPQKGFLEISDIKTTLIGKRSKGSVATLVKGCDPDIVATAYIAFLLRLAVAWARFEAFDKRYADLGFRWSVNLGVPAATLSEEKLRKRFASILAAAWTLAESGVPITIKSIRTIQKTEPVISAKENLPGFPNAALSLIPEIVAEAMGMIKSRMAQRGLYFMVDIGASTLDACTFRISNSGSRGGFHLFTGGVRLFGTYAQKWISEIDITSEQLKHACETLLRRIVWRTKIRCDKNAKEWETELPVLVCGGGSKDNFYEQSIKGIDEMLKQHTNASGARIRPVPLPKNLATKCTPENYHRLAVAWGLSFQEFDVPEIDIPDHMDAILEPPEPKNSVRRRPKYEENFVSKDQV